MTPSYGRTQEQHDNVQKLIDGLKALPNDYGLLEMKLFAKNDSWAKRATPKHPCKTCMCVVGHGPSLGIPFIPEDYDCWGKYSERAFGFAGEDFEWDFCFGVKWPDDINEAIARLEMAQRGEIPDLLDWDYYDLYN